MAINPNDPIVTVLQEAVHQLRAELKADVQDMEEAMMAVIQNFGIFLKDMSRRIDALEAPTEKGAVHELEA